MVISVLALLAFMQFYLPYYFEIHKAMKGTCIVKFHKFGNIILFKVCGCIDENNVSNINPQFPDAAWPVTKDIAWW